MLGGLRTVARLGAGLTKPHAVLQAKLYFLPPHGFLGTCQRPEQPDGSLVTQPQKQTEPPSRWEDSEPDTGPRGAQRWL
jgi:hypothetical protein